MSKGTRDRLALRMQPETKRKIEQWYQTDNCKSQKEFVEKALNFYADYLSAQDNTLLPTAIKSMLDGRLGVLEDRIARLEFNREVELDVIIGIFADVFQISLGDLKRRRAESVHNVKSTNGLISLEKRVRSRQGQEWDEKEWQN